MKNFLFFLEYTKIAPSAGDNETLRNTLGSAEVELSAF